MREIRAEAPCPPCCGGGEQGCCMYSAEGLFLGLYGTQDLPDSVTINGSSYSRSGAQYGNQQNGIKLEGPVWAKYINGSRSTQQCLIRGGVVDPFLDNYTLEIKFEGEDEIIDEAVTVYRRSLCFWDGPDSCGNIVELFFNPADGSVEGSPQRLARWTIQFTTNQRRQEGPCTGSENFILDKSPPNNSPVGEYGDFEAGAGAKIE